MRILKMGIIPSDRIHVTECYKCDTEFEFQESEAEKRDDQREGSYLQINCPLCNNLVTKSLGR